jgi:ribosomal protein L11 methyltransferase
VIRLALRVRGADAELVLAELLELAPGGVEERELPAIEGGEPAVEYAVYGAPGELPEIPDLYAAAGGALVEVSTSEVADDWSERWRRFHRPVLIESPTAAAATTTTTTTTATADGGAPSALYVRPPWEPPGAREGAMEVVIDPAQAFGTGAHATTQLCLELLLELAAVDGGGPVLDVGAGSGVLAIAAVKLGFEPVLALDNDRESVLATASNAEVNGVELEARRFDLRAEELPWPVGVGDWDGVPVTLGAFATSERVNRRAAETVVLANLLRPLLLELADSMRAAPRHLIAGGLLCEQAEEVAAAFATRLGLRERARREQGEWAALWLESPR